MQRSPLRRLATSVVAAAAIGMHGAGPAHAAVVASVTSPGEGATVAAPVAVQVRVERDLLDAAPERVEVQLSHGGSVAAGRGVVALRCVDGCQTPSQTWGGVTLDPRTSSPFGGGVTCNGRHVLRARVDGGDWSPARTVVFRTPPAAPHDVVATGGNGRATVTWSASPTPDVTGYRVEHRTPGGTWSTDAELGSDARRRDVADLAAGRHEVRVVALRGDGRDGSGAATACADRGRDLATPSAVATATVAAPAASTDEQPSSGGDGSGTGGGTGGGSAGDEPTTTGGAAGDGEGGAAAGDGVGAGGDGASDGATGGGGTSSGDGTAGAADGGDGGTAAPSPRPTTRRVSPPRAPVRTGVLAAVPDVAPSVAEPRYIGEDDEFSTTLFDGVALPAPRSPDGVREPSGPVATQVARVVPEDAAASIAGGLVLVTLGMHLLRVRRRLG